MTNLIPIIFWSSIGAIALAFIIALICLRLPRESGPWLVCRVAADGSGGVEFLNYFWYENHWLPTWVNDPFKGVQYQYLVTAEKMARDLLADVVPLSRYTNPPSKGFDSLMEGLREAKEHVDGTKKHPVKRVGKGNGRG